MSHGKRRKATDCLNCGSELQGPYCHFCGQENLEPKETVIGLVAHFIYDITHFDGKFFSSIKYLLLRPGFLAKEYMRGRRASYLNPIRMYVFTSAFFFIIVFSLTKTGDILKSDHTGAAVSEERLELIEQLKNVKDSTLLVELSQKLRKSDTAIVMLEQTGIIEKSPYLSDSTRAAIRPAMEGKTNIIDFGLTLPASEKAYDSAQAALPKEKRDGWIKHYLAKKALQVNERYHNRPTEFKEHFLEKFFHSLPKLMFVSMPFVAFFLWLLYIRHKRYYYVNHAMVIIYIYIALYVLIIIGYSFSWLYSSTHWPVFNWLQISTALFAYYYIYKTFRNFYEQHRLKTFFKYLAFLFATFFLFAILAVVFVLNSLLYI